MKKKLQHLLIASIAIAFLLSGNQELLHAQGTPDPNFGTGGQVTTKVKASNDEMSQSVAIQSDGKIVVGGNSFGTGGFSNIAVIRYKQNGKLDKTFNGNGKKSINNALCNVVSIQPDGKIVIGGSVTSETTTAFGLWRLNSDGSSDSTFGTNGYQTVSFSGTVSCFAMKLQNDGKILIGGNDGGLYSSSSLLLARLNANGEIDNTFSEDGKFSLHLTNKSLTCNEILIQPDGKIIAVGFVDSLSGPYFLNEYFATRLEADGTTDNSFGNNGIVRAKNSNSDNANCAVLLSGGRMVMAGFSQLNAGNSASALCLNANGTVDSTFGTNGWVYPSFYGGAGIMRAAALQKNGKIILAGNVYNTNSTWSVGLARLNVDGSADSTFGNAGLDTFFNAPAYSLSCNDAVLQRNGKILITGYKMLDHYAFFTARFLNARQFQKETTAVNNTEMGVLNIFPVPANSNKVMLSFKMSEEGDATICVYDMHGRTIMTPLYLSFQSGAVTQTLSLPENLANGIYICTVTINGTVRTVKFLVEK